MTLSGHFAGIGLSYLPRSARHRWFLRRRRRKGQGHHLGWVVAGPLLAELPIRFRIVRRGDLPQNGGTGDAAGALTGRMLRGPDAMFLDYFALGLMIVVFVTVFYGIIALHDIPYEIARRRDHPHQDAIHAAGWVSLFTVHVLWPFLWIWAMAYRPERGWGFSSSPSNDQQTSILEDHEQRLAALERMTAGRAPELPSAPQSESVLPAPEISDPRI